MRRKIFAIAIAAAALLGAGAAAAAGTSGGHLASAPYTYYHE